MADRLRRYGDKRDPSTTSEPGLEGTRRRERRGGKDPGPRFVIQKHDASSLHYDFRLGRTVEQVAEEDTGNSK